MYIDIILLKWGPGQAPCFLVSGKEAAVDGASVRHRWQLCTTAAIVCIEKVAHQGCALIGVVCEQLHARHTAPRRVHAARSGGT